MQIAIDGPVVAGKGTVGKLVAKRLGYLFVDTGALFRAISVFCDQEGVTKEDEQSVCTLITEKSPQLEMRDPAEDEMDGRLCTVTLNGKDISWNIRTDESSRGSSLISGYLCVRDFLLILQKDLAKNRNVVMEGRDIGSFVLPNADLKIFLTAKDEIRAKRRHQEMLSRGIEASSEQVLKDIQKRDKENTERPLRPLRKAENAIEIDTSEMTIDEVVNRIIILAREYHA